jgi:hypothetical protein
MRLIRYRGVLTVAGVNVLMRVMLEKSENRTPEKHQIGLRKGVSVNAETRAKIFEPTPPKLGSTFVNSWED